MKIIIFDFDGTIADTFPVVVDIFHKVSKRETQLKLEETRIFRRVAFGQVKGRAILRHAEDLHVSWWHLPFLFAAIKLILKGRMGDVLPMPGMEEVVKRLHDEGDELIIVSSNSKGNISKWLRKEGLTRYFTRIYGGVRTGGKADVIEKIMSDGRKKDDQFWLVSDEGRDIKAAHKAGVKSIAVTWGYNDLEQLENESPTKIAENTKNLIEALSS